MSMSADSRLIVGLDLPSLDLARDMVARLGEAVSFYKVGLTLLARPGGVVAAGGAGVRTGGCEPGAL